MKGWSNWLDQGYKTDRSLLHEVGVITIDDVLKGKSEITRKPGYHIYVITNGLGNPLYVGKTTVSVRKRFWQHWDDGSKIGLHIRTNAPASYDWPVKIYRADRRFHELEIELIRELSPQLNIVRR